MSDDPIFVRHHLPIILDVPEKLAKNPVRSVEVLNLICTCLTEAIEKDERLQVLLRRYGIEWGWEQGTWEP
ncbi:MAG: hypothetical protein SH847_05200 [Roseiflexaceae bacterium]|nr:hypothetical protein [Roseiflexaceae bacterium]